MKRFILFTVLSLGIFLIPTEGYAQKKETGNWELGFYKNNGNNIGDPFYQVIIPGFNLNNEKKVKLIIKVDIAVINGFTISLLDDNDKPIKLGWDVQIGFSENYRTDKNIRNFIQVDRTHARGEVCYIESQSQINKLADLLCTEDFAIFIIVANGDNKIRYGAIINDETKHLEEAVDNLLYISDLPY